MTRPTPLKGGKVACRACIVREPGHGASSGANRGVQGVRGPAPKAKRAAGGRFEFAHPGLLPGDFIPHRIGAHLGSFE